MPLLARLRNCSLYIYADDHPPPHFHVRGPDSNGVIDIASSAVVRGEVSRRDQVEALAWAAENLDKLMAEWRRCNERD